jgi:hypothetical protein
MHSINGTQNRAYHIDEPHSTNMDISVCNGKMKKLEAYKVIMISLWYRNCWKMNRSGKINSRCMLNMQILAQMLEHYLESITYKLGSVVDELLAVGYCTTSALAPETRGRRTVSAKSRNKLYRSSQYW